MKKVLIIIVFSISCFIISGCFKRDNYEGVKIYTTSYPVEYLTNQLYGYNSEVISIYPNGVEYGKYQLSKKQLLEYSKGAIFVYNGLGDEKTIARSFINENEDIKIIDVSYGLAISYGIEELWLSPNNFLMLASTLKNNLHELITNKYINDEINTNFALIEEKLSILDAELRTIGSSAIASSTEDIYVATDMLMFLNDYGFKVTSLQNKENITPEIKEMFKSGKRKYILIDSRQKLSEELIDLTTNYGAVLINVETMLILTDEQIKQKVDYQTIMYEFFENIKKITLTKES